ncbi:MAG TPA: malic enzyme-like NAD(P)-binding protein [Candidatus Limnocylindria bacterium]
MSRTSVSQAVISALFTHLTPDGTPFVRWDSDPKTAEAVSAERLTAGALYPPVSQLRAVSRSIAVAVAREAARSGLAEPNDRLEVDVDAAMWWPA